MIQRVQTIFLLLVAVCMVLFLIFPVWELQIPDTGEVYRIYSAFLLHLAPGVKTGETYMTYSAIMLHFETGAETFEFTYYPYVISGGLAVISIVVAFVEIFSYRNRLTQIKLGMMNALLMVSSLILLVVLSYFDQLELMPEIRGKYLPGLFMPAAALIFNSLANRFIRKDEKLVRSVDRIR
jgi:hypothetical protein